jgi:hypothetical protein
MTDLNMDLKDLTKGQKIAMGVGLLFMVGYVGQQLDPVTPPPNTAPVIRYEAAPKAQPKDDAKDAADLLVGGPKQADQIRRIAKKHNVPAETVADKAAKSAELCGQNDFPGNAIGWSHASLQFVDEITEPIDINDAFVTYVLMGCPQ